MTYHEYRTQALHAYNTYKKADNPDEAARTTFVSCSSMQEQICAQLPYREFAPGAYAMDLQEFIQRYPIQADTYIFSDAPALWRLRQIYPYVTAYATQTLVLFITHNTTISEPIHLQTFLTESRIQDSCTACIVILETGTQATIIDTPLSKATGTNSTAIIFYTAPDAKLSLLSHLPCQDFPKNNTAQQAYAYLFRCRQNSRITATYLLHAKIKTDMWLDVQLEEPDACVTIQGLYAFSESTTARIITQQQHTAPNTTSLITMNGCLLGNAHATYHGRIHIATQAQGSVAQQRNRTLLMSDTAHAISIPSLEAIAHQVHCTHASATGTINNQELVYCMMRGLTEIQARTILLRGFVETALGTEHVPLLTPTIDRICEEITS